MNYSLHNAWSFEDSGLQAALFREEGTDRYVLAIDQTFDLQQVLQDIIDDLAVSSIDVVGHSVGGHLALDVDLLDSRISAGSVIEYSVHGDLVANASIGSANQIIANASPVNSQSLGVAAL